MPKKDYLFDPEPLVIKVASKMFVLINQNSISLKCNPFLASNFRAQYKSIIPGYHLNKQHWNTIHINGDVPDSELKWMIDHSYDLVYGKLTKIEKENL